MQRAYGRAREMFRTCTGQSSPAPARTRRVRDRKRARLRFGQSGRARQCDRYFCRDQDAGDIARRHAMANTSREQGSWPVGLSACGSRAIGSSARQNQSGGRHTPAAAAIMRDEDDAGQDVQHLAMTSRHVAQSRRPHT